MFISLFLLQVKQFLQGDVSTGPAWVKFKKSPLMKNSHFIIIHTQIFFYFIVGRKIWAIFWAFFGHFVGVFWPFFPFLAIFWPIYWHRLAQPLVQAAFTRGGVEGQALLQVCLHPLPPLLDFGFWRWFWRWFPFPVLRRFEFWRVFPAPFFWFLRRFEFWRLFCLLAWFLRSKNEEKFNIWISTITCIIDIFYYIYFSKLYFLKLCLILVCSSLFIHILKIWKKNPLNALKH